MEIINGKQSHEKENQFIILEDSEFYQYKTIASPVGPLTLLANSRALLRLDWGADIPKLPPQQRFVATAENSEILSQTQAQLSEYFCGVRTHFEIPLAPSGTDFQINAWKQLLKIPYGHLATYGEQASRMGCPKSSRAVGAANGKNPIGIIIPCHRVIGASGHLTGFAGGLKIKQYLLDLERIPMNVLSTKNDRLTKTPMTNLPH